MSTYPVVSQIIEARPRFTGELYSVIVTPDLHAPYEDKAAESVVEQYAANHKVDEWIDLGDFLDLDFISRFAKDNDRSRAGKLLDEHYSYGREVLDRRLKIIRSNTKNAKYTLIEGNHDNRVEAYLDKHSELEGIIEYAERLELKKKKINFVRSWEDKSIYKLGHAYFTHGLYIGAGHARKMVETFLTNIFYGHTHDVMTYSKSTYGHNKTIVGQSCGCLCRLDQAYIKGSPSNWQQAFAHFYFFPDGMFSYVIHRIFNGRMADGIIYKSLYED